MKNRKLLNSELGRISPEQYVSTPGKGFVVVLDNIRSAHNVGSAFRTADAFKADKVILCGICAVPPSAEIHKTALGAESCVPWEHWNDTMEAMAALKNQGYRIVCVEQTEDAVSLGLFKAAADEKYAFIFGNEVEGVRQDVAEAADFCLEIPQYGTKHSLNVSVSIGITLWQAVNSELHSDQQSYYKEHKDETLKQD